MVYVEDLKLGDVVLVRTRDRGFTKGIVTEIGLVTDDNPDGLKNGMSGICYDDEKSNKEGGWCYQSQIERKL